MRLLMNSIIAPMLLLCVGGSCLVCREAAASASIEPQIAVYAGYYDTHHHSTTNPKPNPWSGSPNVIFVGRPDGVGGGWDASAVRVANLGTTTLSNVIVTVDIGAYHYALWSRYSIPPGNSLILTQTIFENFDGSDNSTPGCYTCDSSLCVLDISPVVPVVHLSIDGARTDYVDDGQVLNTGGADMAGCPYSGSGNRSDESQDWIQIHPRPASIPLPAADRDIGLGVRNDVWVTDGQVHETLLSGNTLYLAGSFRHVAPAIGGGVPVHAISGAPMTGFPRVSGSVHTVIADGSGGWFVGGDFRSLNGIPRSNLAHVLADNSVAPWNPGTNGRVLTLAKIGTTLYVGGGFTIIAGQPRSGLAALDATSGLASSWNPDANGEVHALATTATTVYAGGAFTRIGGQARKRIAALNLGTGLATAWNANADRMVDALAVSGGTVYAGGGFTVIRGVARNRIAALDATSAVPTPWNPNAFGGVRALVVNAGTVYAGGTFATIDGQPRNGLAALDSITGHATAWNPNADGEVHALVMNGGTVYAGGNFNNIGGQTRSGMAAVGVGDGLATAWNPGANGHVHAVAVSGSTVYVGGALVTTTGQARNGLAAIDVTTGLPTAWNPNPNGPVYALAEVAGIIYAGGNFTNIGGQARANLAALDAITASANAFNPNATGGEVLALAAGGAAVYAAGSFTAIGGQARTGIAALNPANGLATSWNPRPVGLDANIIAVALNGATLYAAGTFDSIGGQVRNGVAALDVTTGLATAWNPNANSLVYELEVSGGTVYVGGAFSTIGGQTRSNLAALDATTGAASPAWDSNANQPVLALAVSGSTAYAGGGFSSIGGQMRSGIAALDATTGHATSWDPNVDSYGHVATLAVNGSAVYAGGRFSSIGFLPQNNFAAIGTGTTDVPPLSRRGDAALLHQNVPNPFGGSSLIRFEMVGWDKVTLKVYDLAGREVATLMQNESTGPGVHEVAFRGHGLASGVYLYRLSVGSIVETKRMVLFE